MTYPWSEPWLSHSVPTPARARARARACMYVRADARARARVYVCVYVCADSGSKAVVVFTSDGGVAALLPQTAGQKP